MNQQDDFLALSDENLLSQSDVHFYKSSGPGGQHRNKVSSAVRIRHRPTGVSAHGDDSRSQHDNKALAIKRLRMNIACQCRRPLDAWLELAQGQLAALPQFVEECTFVARGGDAKGKRRLEVGLRDGRFWHVASFVLDALDHFKGQLSSAAAHMGISTGNLVSLLKSDRHLLAAAQDIRKAHGQKAMV